MWEVDEMSHFMAVEQSRPKKAIIELPDICSRPPHCLPKDRFISRPICKSVLLFETSRINRMTPTELNKAIQYGEAGILCILSRTVKKGRHIYEF